MKEEYNRQVAPIKAPKELVEKTLFIMHAENARVRQRSLREASRFFALAVRSVLPSAVGIYLALSIAGSIREAQMQMVAFDHAEIPQTKTILRCPVSQQDMLETFEMQFGIRLPVKLAGYLYQYADITRIYNQNSQAEGYLAIVDYQNDRHIVTLTMSTVETDLVRLLQAGQSADIGGIQVWFGLAQNKYTLCAAWIRKNLFIMAACKTMDRKQFTEMTEVFVSGLSE